MHLPTLEATISVAARLTVLDQATGSYVPFILNEEQKDIIAACLSGQRVVIGKGRQVGASTIIVYLLTLIAVLNPGLPITIVADDQGNSDGLLGKAKHWLKGMGIKLLVDNVTSITLENGATIAAKSAISPAEGGESKVGRSGSTGVLYATEMAFWRSARAVWASITGTALTTMRIFIDSTGAPGKTLFREILEDNSGKWTTLFFGVEQHVNYRMDEHAIDDETWAMLQEVYGFKRRDSAAWWWTKLQVDFKGDAPRMLREFPVRSDHMFTFKEGLHISKFREVTVTKDGEWDIYPALEPEPLILAVDTSAGIGQDAQAMALVGHRSGKIHRTFKNNLLPIPQYIALALDTVERFNPVAVIVESNAVGEAVWASVQHVKGAEEQRSGNRTGEVQERRDRFRDDVEAGLVLVGGHLLEEIQACVVKAKPREDGTVRVHFVGPDDVTSAVSFARKWRAANPWRPPRPAELDHRDVFVPRHKRRTKVKGY